MKSNELIIQLSGCAIINEKKELLLLWKRKHSHYEFPGGKVETGETTEQTAVRECKEELNIDVRIVKYLGAEIFHIDGRCFESHKYQAIIEREQIPQINEPDVFEKLFWLPMRDYTQYSCAPNVKTLCQQYIDGKLQFHKI